MADPIVGIDLGTSNTVVAYADAAGSVKVLGDDAGLKIQPSVVSFHPNGGVIVGASAKQRKVIDPQNTIYSVKRLIGRSYRSPEVQTAKARVPYQIKEGANQLPLIVTRGGEFAIPEVSAIVLDHARGIAQRGLGQDVARAVVTVPASFNDAQRSATATAGAIAGLTVVRVLNEPTAAALAYGHARELNQIIAVYDFGGGTFDVTVLRLRDNVYEVLGTAGDTFLGGDDLDERLVDKMVAKFLVENRVDLRTNEVSMMRLRAVAEQTKIELSRRSRAIVRIDEIAYGPNGSPLNLQIEITRDEFVRHVADVIDKTFPVCREALNLADVGTDSIDDIIMVGGTTKIPYVRDQVSRFFSKAPRTDVNPEDAVAIGAALQASTLDRLLARPRRSSKQVAILDPTGDNTGASTISFTSEEPPGEVPPKRTTAEYTDRKVDRATSATSYSMTRAGVKETFDTKTGASGRPGEPAAIPGPAQPLARMSRTQTLGSSTGSTVTIPGRADTTGVGPPPVPKRSTSPGERPQQIPIVPLGGAASTKPGIGQVAFFSQEDESSDVTQIPGALDEETPYPAPGPHGHAPDPARGRPVSTQPLTAAQPIAPATAPTMVAQLSPASTAPGMAPGPKVTAPGFAAAPSPPHAPLQMHAPSLVPVPQAPDVLPVPGMGYLPPQGATILEVTPRGLGIATVAGYCEELIRRNSRVPTEIKKTFSTSRDKQDLVRIVVCQGESRRLDANVVIGDLVLKNLPPRPRGETSIEVTFVLDGSGILQVRARDANTGREQSAQLDLVGGMAGDDVGAARERIAGLRR